MPLLGGAVVKRGLDVFLSAVLLLILLPVLLVSAVIIWITSPGPALFRQVRMGRGFKPFEILKFRTMFHAEAGPLYTLGPDARITTCGKWLRRTKLDELPQLWNVLRGEMSLVGPRPVLPDLTYEFRTQYETLLRVRPGLTDPASLKYSQESRLIGSVPEPDRVRFFKTVVTPDKLKISLEYVNRATLWTDATTILMTGVVCCVPSFSRLYGELPDPKRRSNAAMHQSLLSPESASVLNFVNSQSALLHERTFPDVAEDGCIFSYGLVEVEAAEQEPDPPYNPTPGRIGDMPWVRLPSRGPGGQSTSPASDS